MCSFAHSFFAPVNHYEKPYYIGAVSQCVASCKSLNFGDSVVMGEFMESLYGTRTSLNNKCIELPNGSTVTPKEAIAWLKKQEEESDE